MSRLVKFFYQHERITKAVGGFFNRHPGLVANKWAHDLIHVVVPAFAFWTAPEATRTRLAALLGLEG